MTAQVCWMCGIDHPEGEPCTDARDSRIDTLLEGKYEIIRVLGAGGMGKVYEARHKEIGRRVAIKFLLPEFAAHPEVIRRFKNEARAAGKLDHENIAAVHDIGQASDGSSFLVMDYLAGEDCEKLLSREGPLPVPRAVNLILQVCRGLYAAHAAEIVHRDLKPANLFIVKRADRSDWIKILDFGIAKLRTDDQSKTATGLAMGTAHYMSPEQARGDKSVDQRTDVYALGVILYELLSGKKPHTGDTYLEIIYSILHNEPEPLERLRQGLPPELAGVIRKAMCIDLARRFPTVAHLGEALIPFAGVPVASFRSQMVSVTPADPGDHTMASGSESAKGAGPGSDSGSVGVTASTTAPVTPKTRAAFGVEQRGSKVRWAIGLTALAAAAASSIVVWSMRAPKTDAATGASPLVSVPPTTNPSESIPQAAPPVLAVHPAIELAPSGHQERPDSGVIAPAASAASPANPVRPRVPPNPQKAGKSAEKTATPASTATLKASGPAAIDINREPNF